VSPLKQKILDLIRANGPISIAEYMTLALYDPEHGFYMTRDPFGARGAFTTAPEISQMFGELIGAFFVQAWEDRGRPERFHFIELGPGRGTLMADMLRAARVRPGFEEAAQVTLVEASPKLRGLQGEALRLHDVRWVSTLPEVSRDSPLLLVANEFFDALPMRQYVKAKDGWHERMIGAEDDRLVFVPARRALDFPLAAPTDAPDGALFEISMPATAVAGWTAMHIAARGGVALVIDYGPATPGFGDTFQAVQSHRPADPLAEPGEADLTSHVDFAMLGREAHALGAYTHGPVTQKAFLESLGIRARTDALVRSAPVHRFDFEAAVARLTGDSQMGTLFKVMAICDSPRAPTGFPC
jgi:SAM-dependent MidA family methyltransferase